MTHPRQTIREAVLARLLNATSAGAAVFKTRTHPLKGGFPAILIYTLKEPVEGGKDSAPRLLTRVLNLAVEVAHVADDFDDVVDTVCAEIEALIEADPTFGGLVEDSVLAMTEIGFDDEGERPVGAARMTFDVTYHTEQADAAGLDDFVTARASFDVAPKDAPAAVDAEAKATMETE